MLNNPRFQIVHCSDVRKSIGSQFSQVESYHKSLGNPVSSLGFSMGYHKFYAGGKRYIARLDTDEGAHCNQVVSGLSMNLQSLSYALGFDGDVEYPDERDVANMRADMIADRVKYSIPNDREHVRNHRSLNTKKTCPGSLLSDDWAWRISQPEQAQIEAYQKTLIGLLKQLLLKLQMQLGFSKVVPLGMEARGCIETDVRG